MHKEDFCGEFDETGYEEYGQCFPYRVKRDCEAPAVSILWTNRIQQVINECAPGSGVAIIVITVPPGSFSSPVNQATADAIALAYAEYQAQYERSIDPCL